PARSSSRWLGAPASAGSSRSVGMCMVDQRTLLLRLVRVGRLWPGCAADVRKRPGEVPMRPESLRSESIVGQPSRLTNIHVAGSPAESAPVPAAGTGRSAPAESAAGARRGQAARASQAPARTWSAASSRVTARATAAYGGRPASAAIARAVAPDGWPDSASAHSGTAQPSTAPAVAASTPPRPSRPAAPSAPAATPTGNGTHQAPRYAPSEQAARAGSSGTRRLTTQAPDDRARRRARGRHRQVLTVPPQGHQVVVPGRGRVLRLAAGINALRGHSGSGQRRDHPPARAGGRVKPAVGGVLGEHVAARRARAVAEAAGPGDRGERAA